MRERPHLITGIVASVLLVLAIAPLPYDYYRILRWVIYIAALHLESIGIYWRKHGTWWVAIVFGCVAILFNPFNPAELTKAAWIVMDIVCSIFFVYTAFAVKKPPEETYGLVEISGGLIGSAFFTGLAFGGLLLLRELLMIFPN